MLRPLHKTHPQFAAALLVSLAMLLGTAWPAGLAAQVEPKGEVTPVMATGRVVFTVADHAIIVAAIEGGGAPGSRLPVIVPIGPAYIAVLSGTVEWDTPNSTAKPVRLDAELPRTAANAIRRIEHPDPNQPSEIEQIGIATLELIRPLVEKLHDKLNLPPDQPLFQLILADYAVDYGPEIWKLEYRIQQEDLGNDYWQTRPLRPAYYQLYPPDKGRPHTLIEVPYPKTSEPGLLDRMARHDPQLDPIGTASAEMGTAISAILGGSAQKAPALALADFLHAALPAAYGAKARLAMALLDDRRGFQWLLPPEDPLPAPDPAKPVDPGAPTLRKYTPTQ